MSKMQRKPPRPPMQLTCDACGKTFMRAPSKYKAKYNFCSEACAWTAHREAVTGRAERVQILITCSIPVYPECGLSADGCILPRNTNTGQTGRATSSRWAASAYV